MRRPINKMRQQGAALITALFISALVSLIAIHMAFRQSVVIHKLLATTQQQQLVRDFQGMQAWGIANLESLAAKPQNHAQGGISLLPHKVLTKDLNGWHFAVQLQDQQQFYNINTLTNQDVMPTFAAWLHAMQPQVSLIAAERIAREINAWVGGKPTPDDEYYAKLDPAYRAPHHPMFDVSELNLLHAFNTNSKLLWQLRRKLQRQTTALPGGSQPVQSNMFSVAPSTLIALYQPTGANPVPVGVVMSKFSGCQKELLANPPANPGDAMKICMGQYKGVLDYLSAFSNYFLIKVSARRGNTLKYYTSLVRVGLDSKKHITTHVLWQRYFVGAN